MQGRAYPSLLLCTVPMLLAYVGTYIAQLEPEIWAPRMLHKCILYSSTYIDRYGAFAFFFFFFFFFFFSFFRFSVRELAGQYYIPPIYLGTRISDRTSPH